MLTDEEIRLKCIDLVSRQSHYHPGHPIETMVHAQMLYRYVKTGALPMVGVPDAEEFSELVVEKAFEALIEKRKNRDNPSDSSDEDPVKLSFLNAIADNLCAKLGRVRVFQGT